MDPGRIAQILRSPAPIAGALEARSVPYVAEADRPDRPRVSTDETMVLVEKTRFFV
jgi:hypothetical protein